MCETDWVTVFFNDAATTEVCTLSLHDALPILLILQGVLAVGVLGLGAALLAVPSAVPMVPQAGSPPAVGLLVFGIGCLLDRKSTRLNSSHANISYAVFCLIKKTRFSAPRLPYV